MRSRVPFFIGLLEWPANAFSSAGVATPMWAGFDWQTHGVCQGHSSVCSPAVSS